MSDRKVLVVYDTRYGNTYKVAEALTRGFGTVSGVSAVCRPVDQVHSDDLEDASLLVIGGPTEFFSESRHMREFFQRIGGFDLHRKYGFAFDTHARNRLSGSAARTIERDLTRLGVTMLEPHQSAFTVGAPGQATPANPVSLEPGSEAHFEAIGAELGKSLLTHAPLLSNEKEAGFADAN